MNKVFKFNPNYQPCPCGEGKLAVVMEMTGAMTVKYACDKCNFEVHLEPEEVSGGE